MRTVIPLLCALVGVWSVPAAGAAQASEREIEGMIDLHSHAAPDAESRGPRSLHAIEAAETARRHGMRAIVLKNHYTETASQAYLVTQVVPGIEVYGGITLNRSVGGINPAAVANMATITGRLGRVVWLPTFDSENNSPDGDNVPITRDGSLLPEVRRVFDVMREHGLSLATGHVRPEESLLAIREARAMGIDRIVVTHPSSALVAMSVEMQREAARLGALLEYTISGGRASMDQLASQIRAVGPENVVLTSDLGQSGNPLPADGFRWMAARLRDMGFSGAEIDAMTKRNPARFLGLE